ncbi:MAG: hypothetical protein HYY01_05125 [Chloroflexi bacterium]|nr:hypothetical protein [Chloroflexota bacterium]
MGLVQELLAAISSPSPFPSSQYPFAVNQSLYGRFDLYALYMRAQAVDEARITDHLETVLALAEAVEASQPDRADYFLSDREVRARLNRLNSSTGWALVWGQQDSRTEELLRRLDDAAFQSYVVTPGAGRPATDHGRHVYLGSRPTSAIYYAQALLRYPHIYGRVPLGEHHQASHFLEEHGPGVILVAKDELSPLERAMVLGIMSLGVPAVAPPSLGVSGNVRTADGPEAMVAQAMLFPNLRVRATVGFQLNLPVRWDPAFASQKVSGGDVVGGSPMSSFVVTNEEAGDGVDVVGQPGPDLGLAIAAGDPAVDITMTEYLEEVAVQVVNYLDGVSLEVKDGRPTLTLRSGLALDPRHLALFLHRWLKAEFTIGQIRVRLSFLPQDTQDMAQAAAAFRERRRQALATASEETELYFYGCVRCHSFGVEHSCTVTPERPPLCGKTWTHIKTRALLSPYTSDVQYARRNLGMPATAVAKGACLDPQRGEYEGVNDSARRRSGGRVERVFLHSIFSYPHTSCSCFGCVVFHIPEVDGIGVMQRGFAGASPDGRTWDALANTAAGKQVPGCVGVGTRYLESAKFLQGDGGWQRVVWLTSQLKQRFAPNRDWIATEKDVDSPQGLKEFVSRASRGR